MSSLPRPRHFITRPDGTMTPLIALDEMPDDVRIMNVPTTLTPEQTVGMMSMGMEPKSTGKYSVEVTEQESALDESVVAESVAVESVAAVESMAPPPVPTATKPESLEPATKSSSVSTSKDLRHSHHAVQEEPTPPNTLNEPQHIQHVSLPTFTQPTHGGQDNQPAANGNLAGSSDVNIIERSILDWRRSVGSGNAPENVITTPTDDSPSPVARVQTPGQQQPHAAAAPLSNKSVPTVANGSSSPYNPTTAGVFSRKVFCSHWLRTGECDFIQQGCIFQHVMPSLEVLATLGFRYYPRWFRENLLMDGRPIPPMEGEMLRQPPRQQPFRQPPLAVHQQPPRQSLTPALNNIDQRPMYGRPGPRSTYTGSVAQARGAPPPANWTRWPARDERPGHVSGTNIRPPHNRVLQAVNPWQHRQPRHEAQLPQRRGPPSVASEWNPNLPPQPFDRVIKNAAPRTHQAPDLITATPSVTESIISTMPPSPNLAATSYREGYVPRQEPVHTQEIISSSTLNPTPRVNLPTTTNKVTILARPAPPHVTTTPEPPQTSSLSSAPTPVMAATLPTTAAAVPPSAPPQVTAAPPHISAAADQTSAPNPVMPAPETSSSSTTAAGHLCAPPEIAAASHNPTAPQDTGVPLDTTTPHHPNRPHRREKTRIYGPQPLPQYPSLRPSAPELNSANPIFTTPPKQPTHRPLNDLLPEAPEVKVVKRFATFVAPDARVLSQTASEGDKVGDGKPDARDPAIIAQGGVNKEGVYRPGSFGSLGSPTAGRKGGRRPSDAESNLMDLGSA